MTTMFEDPTIYTRADGTPIPRPERDDYSEARDYVRAMYEYREAIADVANEAFDKQFRKSVRTP